MIFTEIPLGLAGKLFRSRMPFTDSDPNGAIFARYQREEVTVVVLLADDEECINRTGRNLRSFYQEQGLEVLHLPTPDFGVPTKEALQKTLSVALDYLEQGENVVVHCNAGIGRTGMLIACLAKTVMGKSGEESIQWVRQYIPAAVEIEDQMRMVIEI